MAYRAPPIKNPTIGVFNVFFAGFDIEYDLLAEVIVALLPPQKDWLLTFDRTHWQFGKVQINILMVGLIFQGVAFPLYWTLLPKKGNSNTQERITLMEQVVKRLGLGSLILQHSRVREVES